MAEAAGLVIGGVGLLALFDTCMSAFEYIDAGRHYGKDYQKAALKLEVLQIQLSRWKSTVDIRDDLTGISDKVQVATQDEVKTVEKLLGEINNDLEDARKTSKRYELETLPPPDESAEAATLDAVTMRMRQLAVKRQKRSSFGQKTLWALRDNRKVSRLIEDLSEHVNSLVQLFPAVVPKQVELAVTDMTEVVQPSGVEEPDDEALNMLREASADVDPQLSAALQTLVDAKGGYSFNNMTLLDHAKAVYGTYYADGQYVRGHKANATFNNVHARNHAVALYGDQIGGPSPLGAGFHQSIHGQAHGHTGAVAQSTGRQMQGYGGSGAYRGGSY